MQITHPNDQLLLRLFCRHFTDAAEVLRRLERYIAQLQLPFDFKDQLRELQFPPQPGLPQGRPSFIYYFVPSLSRGTFRSATSLPNNPAYFLNSSDGVGINLGCPVRLLHAIDALQWIPENERLGVLACLKNPGQHLDTVEELLWLTGWISPREIRRGGVLAGSNGDVDWFLEANSCPLYVEAKFRRSDWPRITDGGGFTHAGDGFLTSAVHKFPVSRNDEALRVVGITTFANADDVMANIIGAELGQFPQIDAVIIRSMVQMTHVISLHAEICDRLAAMLGAPSLADFPFNYVVIFNRQARDARLATDTGSVASASLSVHCHSIQPRGDEQIPVPESDLYRINIPSRGTNDEPNFEVSPKYILQPT